MCFWIIKKKRIFALTLIDFLKNTPKQRAKWMHLFSVSMNCEAQNLKADSLASAQNQILFLLLSFKMTQTLIKFKTSDNYF